MAWLRLLILLGDALMLVGGMVGGAAVANVISPFWADTELLSFRWPLVEYRISLLLPLWVMTLGYFYIHGLYSRRLPWWLQVKSILFGVLFMLMIDGFLIYLWKMPISRIWVVSGWACTLLLLIGWRLVVQMASLYLGWGRQETYVIGSGMMLLETLRALHADRFGHYRFEAVVDLDGSLERQRLPNGLKTSLKIETNLEALGSLWLRRKPTLVVFCPTTWDAKTLMPLIQKLKSKPNFQVAIVPPVGGLPINTMESTPFFGHDVVMMGFAGKNRTFKTRALKRLIDMFGASFALLIFGLPMAVVAAMVALDGGKPWFAHARVGRNGKTFRCLKLRSMVKNSDDVLQAYLKENPKARKEWETDHKLKNDPRITRLGRFIRASSFDELPQLLNVLRGDMSLVGPRPIVAEEKAKYGERFEDYIQVRPGLTGLWQVSGRNDIDYDYRTSLDSWYVNNLSVWNDIVIIIKTIGVVVLRRGAY